MATGAGVFGVPLWVIGRRLLGDAVYWRGRGDGAEEERRRWSETVLCAREWSCPDIGPDGETLPPHTLAEWVEHAQARHGPFKYHIEQHDDV